MAPSSDRRSSSRLDIDLEQMEALADPTLPSEIRARNLSQDSEEKIQREVMLHGEYTRMLSLYRQLQAAVASGDMPDFRRVSASLPPEISAVVESIAAELMTFSLYASTDIVFVRKELEAMIKEYSFEERITTAQERQRASAQRLERLRAVAFDPEEENKRMAEEILATMNRNEHTPVSPAPEEEEQSSGGKEGFWRRIRKRLFQ